MILPALAGRAPTRLGESWVLGGQEGEGSGVTGCCSFCGASGLSGGVVCRTLVFPVDSVGVTLGMVMVSLRDWACRARRLCVTTARSQPTHFALTKVGDTVVRAFLAHK